MRDCLGVGMGRCLGGMEGRCLHEMILRRVGSASADRSAEYASAWLANGGAEQDRTDSRFHNRRRGVWQRRFWEHTIVNQEDLNAHLDYIHYNPVKQGLVSCPHAWEFSSFHRWVKNDGYE